MNHARATCLLASSFLLGYAYAAEPKSDWVTIGQGNDVRYEVLRSSIEVDSGTQSVEFVMRSTYRVPQQKAVLERSLALCKQDVFVTMSQLVYNEKNEHVGTTINATVYENPRQAGTVITELMRWACVSFRRDPAPVTPDTRQRPLLSV